MKKSLLFIILLFFSLASYSQGEANIWYFGKNAGIDFNSGSPVALNNGQLNTDEGCATICNSSGQLLFYTDGIKVWDRNHNVMPNGSDLLGHPSSTQSAIILPKPNSSHIYYIITASATDVAVGIGTRYTEVDMNLNGGFGDVTSNKNIILLRPASEKLTAYKHANGTDYWIVMHGYQNSGSNSYYSYLVTSTGISPTPVITNIGSLFFYNVAYTGYLKFSSDGHKLINASSNIGVTVFDFDTANGTLSNPKVVTNDINKTYYGVEFSPSGQLAYVTEGDYSGYKKIVQYDLTVANIPLSAIQINNPGTDEYLGGIQIATDGKLYITNMFSNYIGVINNPNAIGAACNYVKNGVYLGASTCKFGLPNFMSFYFQTDINVQNLCSGNTTNFSLTNSESVTSASWDFGDGSTSTDINPTHIYASPGTYTVSVTATSATGTSTKSKDIVISAVPTATKPQGLLVCDANNDGINTFDLSSQNAVILNGQDPDLYAVNYFVDNVAIVKPNAYNNTVPYQQQSITAEVYNKANNSCKSTTSFTIDVFDTPKPNVAIPKISLCDNISVGTDVDGRVVFDLTQKATAILNGQSATQFILSYYKDAALTQNISNPATYQNTNATETVYVKVANKDNLNCTAVTSFLIEVLALPTITNVVDLKQCDDNTDGFSVFNLEEAITKITSNAAVETISFHKTLADAQNNVNSIVNKTAYTNQVVSADKVFVRIANSNGCYRIAQLNLITSTTQIPATFSRSFTQCDDIASGSNTDGIAAFDFSSVDNEVRVIFPSGQLLDITYYKNLADALAEKNAIADIAHYSNIGYPNTQNIYIRVDSRLNNDCLGLGSYITLKVEAIPIVAPITPFVHCDDNQDGYYAFDITGLDTQIKNGKNVLVTYFDANNNPLPSPLQNPFSTQSQTIKARITNNTETTCFYDTSIQFIVDVLPQTFAVPTALTTVCDDEVDPSTQDGKYAFDTSTFQSTILGSQTGMIVKYFDANNNALTSPLPNPFVTSTQDVKVEVINPSNTNCIATTTIPFVVHPIPNIALEGDELVCSNLPTFTKVIDAGIQDATPMTDFTYVWSFNGQPIVGENNYSLTVNTEGIYTVEVINNQGCSGTRTITVAASDIAVINNVDIVELSDSNTIQLSVSGNGDYVFALDDESGVYQTESTFTNVSAGIHTVYVKDVNGCGVVAREVAVLGIPNYFTPNQDGYNDTWNIKGANATFNTKTLIRIFDRYGKLIKQISPTGAGWDGTFNGNLMPAADYWYSVQLEDGRLMKGHFSLKR